MLFKVITQEQSQSINSCHQYSLVITLYISMLQPPLCRIVESFESITAELSQQENFTELTIMEENVAVRIERVRRTKTCV